MNIIYHCYGGTHSSVTAAAIHLGKLPSDRIPSSRELLAIEFFDRRGGEDIGKIAFMGKDRWGNDVYVTGRRSRPQILYHITGGLADFINIHPESYMLVDAGCCVNTSMRIGGVLSRRFGLVWPGRPVVTRGTILAYKKICRLVEEVQNSLLDRNRHRALKPGNFLFYSPEVSP